MEFVYFILARGTQLVKIGKANNVTKRMSVLQSASPFELELIEQIPTKNAFKLENLLHKHLAQKRQTGEWFLLNQDELSTSIDLAKTQNLSEDDIDGIDKNILEYLASRTALKHRELAKQINWSPSSFHNWIKGQRPIPIEKLRLLTELLENYGFEEN